MSYISRSDIEVKVNLVNSGNIVARASVIFFNTLETHGWRVMRSSKMHPVFGEEIWIQSPSFKTGKLDRFGKPVWKEIVYISDRKTWELVHEMIYDAYNMARSKKDGLDGVQNEDKPDDEEIKKSQVNQTEEVNPDDIPF